MPESPAGFVVADNPAQNQYEGRLDGQLVAHSEYELAPGVITFLHTEVDPELEGQGIGSALASNVLDDVRARGLRVVARCPFIAAYIRRHREYADLLLRTKVGGPGIRERSRSVTFNEWTRRFPSSSPLSPSDAVASALWWPCSRCSPSAWPGCGASSPWSAMRSPWAAARRDSSWSRPTAGSRPLTVSMTRCTPTAFRVMTTSSPPGPPTGRGWPRSENPGAFVTVDVFDADPAAGGQPTTIYKSDERPAFYLYWAPDSRHVSFLTSEPNPDDIALRIAPADASAPAEVVRAAAPFYWAFVDSSRLILHTGSTGSEAFLGEVDLEGDSLEGAAIQSGLFRAPAIGGGGSSRAYVTAASDDPAAGEQLVVEARDGSSRQEIPVAGAAAFSFDPTSTTLAFIALERGHGSSGADPVRAAPHRRRRHGRGADAARRQRARVFLVARRANDRGARSSPGGQCPGPGEAQVLGRSPGLGGLRRSGAALPPFAAEAPGIGLHLSFIDAASGAIRSERDIRVSELFAFQVIPYFDQYALSHRFWAADSSSIVLPIAAEDGLDRVVVIPADGGDPTCVATGSIGFWSP